MWAWLVPTSKRLSYLRQILWRPLRFLILVVIIGAITVWDTIQAQFLPKNWADASPRALDILGSQEWYVWVIAAQVVIVILIFEGSFRASTQMAPVIPEKEPLVRTSHAGMSWVNRGIKRAPGKLAARVIEPQCPKHKLRLVFSDAVTGQQWYPKDADIIAPGAAYRDGALFCAGGKKGHFLGEGTRGSFRNHRLAALQKIEAQLEEVGLGSR